MFSEKKSSLGNRDGLESGIWYGQKSPGCCAKTPSRMWPWGLLGGMGMGQWVPLHWPPAWVGQHLSEGPSQRIQTWESPGSYFRKQSSLFSSHYLLGNAGRSDHPGQPFAGGLWKRQDCEEWQLLEIRKTQSNFQPPPETNPPPPTLDMRNCHIH